MSLIYFEDEAGRTVVVVASKIISLTAKRLPTNTPTLVTCVEGVKIDVRDDIDVAQQKLIAALKESK